MKTDAEFKAWLEDSTAQRVTLYQAGAWNGTSEITCNISNDNYTGDTANPYVSAVARDLVVVDAITREGGARLSADQLGIYNIGGERDAWLNYVWRNRTLKAYVGDKRWPLADFVLVFSGVIKNGKGNEDGTEIILDLNDITERINTPVSEVLMADGSLAPVTFGEVLNISPKLKNAATGEHTSHPTAIEDVIEARVEAKKRTTITKNLATGSFTFQTAVGPGAATCSVQGDKTGGVYRKTIASIVRLLVTGYGKVGERFLESEIDDASFNAFEAANPYTVGLHLAERTNVIEACSRLTKSVQGHLVPSRVGLLRLVQYGIPAVSTGSILPSHYVSLKRGEPHPVAAAVKILYCENYTVQPNLQVSIPLEHKGYFATRWRVVTAVDAATRDQYKLTSDPVGIETCLVNTEGAAPESARRLAQDKVPRVPYMLEGTPVTMLIKLGEGWSLYGDRYGMDAGKLGQVTLTSLDLGTYHTQIEVTV